MAKENPHQNAPTALRFESMRELARYLESTERVKGARTWSTDDQNDRTSTHDWPASMAIAHDGGYWAEGADRMARGVADAAALRENAPEPVISNDVAGFMVDIPAAIAGVPDCMYAYEPGEMSVRQSPTVSIGVGTFSYGVTSDSVFNRGVAILTMIDALETAGYRCVLDYVGDNIGDSTSGATSKLLKMRVCLKRAQDAWNPGSVAFALCNASMLRRLTVACIERDAVAYPRTKCGYGRGDNGYEEEYSIAFPYLTGNAGYETIEAALATVERKARDYGAEITLLSEERR